MVNEVLLKEYRQRKENGGKLSCDEALDYLVLNHPDLKAMKVEAVLSCDDHVSKVVRINNCSTDYMKRFKHDNECVWSICDGCPQFPSENGILKKFIVLVIGYDNQMRIVDWDIESCVLSAKSHYYLFVDQNINQKNTVKKITKG
jgi:hypothetical protein